MGCCSEADKCRLYSYGSSESSESIEESESSKKLSLSTVAVVQSANSGRGSTGSSFAGWEGGTSSMAAITDSVRVESSSSEIAIKQNRFSRWNCSVCF